MQAKGQGPPDPQQQSQHRIRIMIMNNPKPKRPERKKRLKELKVRFNEDEYEQILKRQKGKTFGGWLRQVALNIVPISQADPELMRHIGRIGSNLNQIAMYANTEKLIDQNVLNHIVAIENKLEQLIAQNVAKAIEDNFNGS